MPYTPTVWVASVTTLGPTNLNKLESGLQVAASVADAAIPKPSSPTDRDVLFWDSGTSAWIKGKITDAMMGAGAGIAKSKLASLAITDSDVAVGAGIGEAKIALTHYVLSRVVVLTASGTFVAAAGARALLVEAVGGGGAGGGNAATGAGTLGAGGGGGEGAYASKLLITNIGSHVYVVGAGGTGVSAANGNVGADSTFADSTAAVVVRAKGGLGGIAATPAWPALGGLGGLGGPITGLGDIQVAGCVGHTGMTFGSSGGQFLGAPGGGRGGAGAVNNSSDGQAAVANSGGGGGGSASGISSAARPGGAGGSGYIRVWEFF